MSIRKYAVVGMRDFHKITEKKWCCANPGKGKTCYARRRLKNCERGNGEWGVLMHREIMKVSSVSIQVDHVSGNGLDNRRSNLRAATREQNQRNRGKNRNNTSGFKGVSWMKQKSCYRATITHERKQVHLGLFKKAEEAAKAYDASARRLYGAFGKLNFPVNE